MLELFFHRRIQVKLEDILYVCIVYDYHRIWQMWNHGARHIWISKIHFDRNLTDCRYPYIIIIGIYDLELDLKYIKSALQQIECYGQLPNEKRIMLNQFIGSARIHPYE